MAARVVVVGNEKGGVGKTTLAINLAVLAAEDGLDVLLIDADPGQQSASKWAALRHEAHPDAPSVRCVSLTGRAVHAELADLAKRYRVLIVDTGAEDSPEMRSAATAADVLVMPFQPDSLDLWALETMERVVQAALALRAKLRVVAAVNRIPPHQAATAVGDVMAWITENTPRLPVSAVLPLVHRAAYGRATGQGLGVAEMPRRDPKAFSEISSLYEEAMRK